MNDSQKALLYLAAFVMFAAAIAIPFMMHPEEQVQEPIKEEPINQDVQMSFVSGTEYKPGQLGQVIVEARYPNGSTAILPTRDGPMQTFTPNSYQMPYQSYTNGGGFYGIIINVTQTMTLHNIRGAGSTGATNTRVCSADWCLSLLRTFGLNQDMNLTLTPGMYYVGLVYSPINNVLVRGLAPCPGNSQYPTANLPFKFNGAFEMAAYNLAYSCDSPSYYETSPPGTYEPGAQWEAVTALNYTTPLPPTNCTASVWYPTKTSFVSAAQMNISSSGNAYTQFTVPNVDGVYEYQSTCAINNKNLTSSHSFHVTKPRISAVSIK